MKKEIALAIILVLFLIVTIFSLKPSNYVNIEGQKFQVEIPKTLDDFNKGLMFRENLCDNCGMLFIFQEEDFHSFWMKNTLISLDLIHINSNLEIVDIIYAIPCKADPCQVYTPRNKSTYVLEVNGGKYNESLIGKEIKLEI